MRMLVTLSCLLKMSGINSTPTRSDFAWINGALLNLGSSAIESWSAPRLPERTPRLKFPTFTGRPRAELRLDSIWGRKLLTFTRNGSAMTTTINRTTTMPITLRTVFTLISPMTGGERRGSEVEDSLSKPSANGLLSKPEGRGPSRPAAMLLQAHARRATPVLPPNAKYALAVRRRRYKIGAKHGVDSASGRF